MELSKMLAFFNNFFNNSSNFKKNSTLERFKICGVKFIPAISPWFQQT